MQVRLWQRRPHVRSLCRVFVKPLQNLQTQVCVASVARVRSFHRSRDEATAHILAIATEYRQESVIMIRAAELLGYRYQMVGLGEKWLGWGTKLILFERSLRRGIGKDIAADDPVLLVDGWDCALVGPADEFREKLDGPVFARRSIWYAGERICGPDFFLASRLDAIYPDIATPWRYPNAGAMCGRAQDVLRFLQDLLQDLPEDGDDQKRLHLHLLAVAEAGNEPPAGIDSECGIFQCLYEAEPQWDIEDVETQIPRLRNRTTGERPVLLHGNGHTGRWFMQALWREMRFLERCGLMPEDLGHLPFDGAVAPGLVPDSATEKNWSATFQIYKIIEMQLAYAKDGIEYDPWKGKLEPRTSTH